MSEMERAKEIDDAVKAADAKKRADAAEAGEKLDHLLSHIDDMCKRMDARMDAWEAKEKEKAADGSDDGDPTAKSYPGAETARRPFEDGDDPDAPRPLGADSRKDSVRADSEEIAHFMKENGATRAIAADSVLAAIQSDADRASSAWGKSAVQPWDGERIVAYRRRTAREHQAHSPAWKDVDLRTLSGQALRNATAQIFADSIAASSSSESYGETLREVRRRDPDTGHLVKEYYGEPRAWLCQFSGGMPRLARFRLDRTSGA